MDFFQSIFLWLKGFIEKLKSITSFVDKDYLPDEDQESADIDFPFFGFFGKYNKKY